MTPLLLPLSGLYGAGVALRLALYQHMFLRTVMVPSFSRANDISREDVLEMFFTMRVDDGIAQLRRAFPISFPSMGDFTVAEPSDYPDKGASGYAQIHRDFIEPIEAANALARNSATPSMITHRLVPFMFVLLSPYGVPCQLYIPLRAGTECSVGL